jgi:multisubunit Na+/H+ antiporter MnhB subunit
MYPICVKFGNQKKEWPFGSSTGPTERAYSAPRAPRQHKMRLSAIRSRKLVRHATELSLNIALAFVSATVLFRLGNMQLEGLPTFAGGAVGLLFAFTSLQYNRARAYPPGAAQRRGLVAAELALRATLGFTAGVIVTAAIYFMLSELGYQSGPWNERPQQRVPALLAFVPLGFFAYTLCTLWRATRVLLHGMVGAVSVRKMRQGW